MIDGTSRTTATAPTPVNYTGALTPDALMVYCGARLRDIDQQVNAVFARQKQQQNASSAVNTLQGDLNQLVALQSSDDAYAVKAGDTETRGRIAAEFEKAIMYAPEGVKAQLGALYEEWKANPGTEDYNVRELKSFSERLGTIGKEISSSMELDMIGLQSLMSQRQTAVQLITNLVASLGESLKAGASKVGA
jgi:hypothetical protein